MDSMLRHDKARLEALMAPGFVLHTAHPDYPETSRERWLDNLFNHLRIDEWEQTNISAHTYGDVGVVTSAYRWSGSMYEQPFDAKGHCTDVWQLRDQQWQVRSEEHTSELQSLMRISYAVFCLKKKKKSNTTKINPMIDQIGK